jgi:hypothetical protein
MKLFLLPAIVVVSLTLLCGCTTAKTTVPDTARFAPRPAAECPTPPMGYGAYCAHADITEPTALAQVDFLAAHLKAYGWTWFHMDSVWWCNVDAVGDSPPAPPEAIVFNENGIPIPDPKKFPMCAQAKSFKPLTDYVHAKGLKFGLWWMRTVPRVAVDCGCKITGTDIPLAEVVNRNRLCGWCKVFYGIDTHQPHAQLFYDQLAKTWAEWGVDYIKLDDIAAPYYGDEIEMIRKAIDQCGRKITLGISPGDTPTEVAAHISGLANQWRVSNDFWDDGGFDRISAQDDRLAWWAPYSGPGHWADADYLIIGRVKMDGPGGRHPRESTFTAAEKQSLMSLWTMARSPLWIGGDLPTMTPENLSLFTNPEVIAVGQQGSHQHRVQTGGWGSLGKSPTISLWVSDVPDGKSRYVLLINKTKEAKSFSIANEQLGFSTTARLKVRDLWQRQILADARPPALMTALIPPHGCVLYQVTPQGN